MKLRAFATLLVAIGFANVAQGQSAWVTDQLEITLRTGPSTSNAIRLSLSSGTRIEILEELPEEGYTRVRTAGGTEGWVISRYLMNEPSAREQLADLTQQLSNASDEGSSLATQLNGIRAEYREAEQTIARLERQKTELEEELAEIRRTAANVLAIDSQNQDAIIDEEVEELQEDLTNSQISIDRLNEEVRTLSGQSQRNWFVAGAGVLFFGVLLGLWLPRMRTKRRSGYDTF